MDEKNIDLAKKAIMGLGRSLAANLLIQKVESRIDWKIASQMTGSSPTLDKLMQVALIIIYTY
ncbi:MAG: hypothetical protein GKC10_00840 [Methanosarcinales archaeon]|nr:hypothetical protein [Methanosarcinales archaeon]